MEIGISTATFFTKESTEGAYKLLNDLKIPICEVFLSTASEYTADFMRLLLSLRSFTRVYSVHSLSTLVEQELFNPQERTRKDCEKVFLEVAKCCKALDAVSYTFHGTAVMKKLPHVVDEKKIAARLDELRKIMSEVTDGKTELAYENVHWTLFSSPTFFENLRKHSETKAVLDIKQAMLSKYSVYDYIKAMSGRISHVHLCDYDDTGKLAMPSKGTFDFVTLFQALSDTGFDGPMFMELYATMYNSYDEVMRSYDYLRECVFKSKK